VAKKVIISFRQVLGMAKLKEWMLTYLKNRDIYEGRIKSIEECGDDFVIHRDDGDVLVLVSGHLSDSQSMVASAKKGRVIVAALNIKSNVEFLVKNWDSLKPFKGLSFYFVNPDTNDKWVIYPYTHDLITERAALKKGLLSLFGSIPEAEK